MSSNVKASQIRRVYGIDQSFSGLYNKSLVKVINDLKYVIQPQNQPTIEIVTNKMNNYIDSCTL